jgi:hypothetical protein
LALPALFASTVLQQSSCQSVSVPQEFIFPRQFRGLGSRGRGPRGLRRTAAVQGRRRTPQAGTRCLRRQDFGEGFCVGRSTCPHCRYQRSEIRNSGLRSLSWGRPAPNLILARQGCSTILCGVPFGSSISSGAITTRS